MSIPPIIAKPDISNSNQLSIQVRPPIRQTSNSLVGSQNILPKPTVIGSGSSNSSLSTQASPPIAMPSTILPRQAINSSVTSQSIVSKTKIVKALNQDHSVGLEENKAVIDYLSRIEKDSFESLTNSNQNIILEYISKKIDIVAQKVYEDLYSCIIESEEHKKRVEILNQQKTNVGATKTAKAILEQATAFEQMIALQGWFFNKIQGTNGDQKLPKQHTFCFANNRLEGEKIPISIRKNAADMMSVKLGNQSKDYSAPKYDEDLDTNDPWEDPKTENFIYHLEALEIVRQPNYIGATLLKGNAFESEYIDQDWRYGVKDNQGSRREASIEFKSQKRLGKKETAIKIQSAAFNLIQLVKKNNLDEVNLCEHRDRKTYEYFGSQESIPSYFTLKVSPMDIVNSIKKDFTNSGYNNNEKNELYYHLFKLMIAKIGPQSTPSLRDFIIQTLSEAPRQLTIIKC